jgi:Tol biopolymer transport system component
VLWALRVAAVAPLLLLACGGGNAAPAPPAPSAGAPPTDLVYEKVVAGNQDIYLLPADGGAELRLTDDGATDGLPRWKADGSAIVFSSERSGNWQLWEVSPSGGPARRLRTNGNREWQADVSRDGRWLAFLSNQDGPESLWLMDIAKGTTRRLVQHGRRTVFGNPHWSPDGRRIVFSSNHRIGHQIYVVDVATAEQDQVSGLFSGGCEPRFHPDGRRVVYVSRGHQRPTSKLVEHDLETGKEKVLLDWPALNYDPVYSPDASELGFASDRGGKNAVYRLRLADGKSWQVTSGPGRARYPDYRPR